MGDEKKTEELKDVSGGPVNDGQRDGDLEDVSGGEFHVSPPIEGDALKDVDGGSIKQPW